MSRPLAVAGVLLLALLSGAAAQSFPGVAPSVPSPGPSGTPAPPAVAPGPSAIAPGPAGPVPSFGAGRVAPGAAAPDGAASNEFRGRTTRRGGNGSRLVTVPGLPPVVVPGPRRGRDSYSDRVSRCTHYGTAAGVPTNEIGRFTAQCAQ